MTLPVNLRKRACSYQSYYKGYSCKQIMAILNDVKIIQKNDIVEDCVITTAYKRLFEKYELGSQYDWLARYAKQTGQN